MAAARALGLSRAITQCTQPYSQQLSGDVLRALQKYLLDAKSVDTVYYALVDRAAAEPISAAVVAKVVAVLKQLLLRYPPSATVLSAVAAFCQQLQADVALPPADASALQYVAACVQRLERLDSSGHAQAQPTPRSPGPGQPLPKYIPGRQVSFQMLPTVPSGPLSPGGTGSITFESPARSRLPTATMSPTGRAPSGQLPPTTGQQPANSMLLLPEDPGLLPTWALQPPQLLQELVGTYTGMFGSPYRGGGGLQGGGADTRWISQVPELNPSLTSAAPFGASTARFIIDGGEEGGPPAAPISMRQLVRCVLDLSPEEQPAHLEQVAKRLKAEAAQARPAPSKGGGGTAAAAEAVARGARGARPGGHGKAGAGGAGAARGKGGRKRLLFHHPPYTLSDPLQMSEAEIAVVVQVVCGSAAAHALLSHEQDAPVDVLNAQPRSQQGDEGIPQPDASRPSGTTWEDEFDNGDLGQVCGAILIKLIMDLWITAGPENSYALVLRMLRKASMSRKPQMRARVFDLLYNLAIHASLLEPASVTSSLSAYGRTPPPSRPTSRPPSQPGNWTPAASHPTLNPMAHHPAGGDNERSPSPVPMPLPPRASPLSTPQQQGPQGQQGASSQQQQEEDRTEQQEDGGAALGSAHSRLCAWNRALLFQLLEDLAQSGEECEQVWQAALGALLQLCTASGHWVTAHVEALPLQGLAGVLYACLAFRWSTDIHCHLLRLAAVLLVQPSNSPGQQVDTQDTESIADSAAEMEAPSSSRGRTGAAGATEQQQPETRVELIPADFGGLQGVLEAYAHAPTPAACMDMLTVLIHFLTPDNDTEVELAQALASRGAPLFSVALQSSLRAPRPGMAMRLYAALSGTGLGPSPSQTAAASAASTIRLPGGLGNAGLSGSHTTHAVGAVPGGGGVPVGTMLSARLVCSMLSVIEGQALQYRQVLQQSPQLASRIQATVAHISAADGSTPQYSPAKLAAAWQELKDACSCISTGPASVAASTPGSASMTGGGTGGGGPGDASPLPGGPGGALGRWPNAGVDSSGGGGEGRSLRSARSRGRSQNELRSSMVLMSPPTITRAGRQVALHWLYEVLLQAMKVCQGNPLSLTPLNLRTSDAGKLPSTTSMVMGLRGPGQAGQSAEQSPARVSSWTGQLADVLLHCVREVVGGCSLLVAAMARAVSDLKQSVPDPTSRQHLVMSGYYIALLWVMQSGDVSPGSDSHMAAQELADHVLAAISQHRTAPAPTMESNAPFYLTAQAPAAPAMASAFLRARLQQSTSTKAMGSSGPPASWLLSQHLHVATALVVGQTDFAPEPLQATAPELLVALIRSCAQQKTNAHAVQRGLYGRPHASATAPGQAEGIFPGSAAGLPGTAWEDAALDRRLALLMALMARCMLDPDMFAKYGLSHLVKEAMLPSEDARERYYAGVYLLRHWQLNQQDKYWRMLRQLVLQAQQLNDDTLLDNPYLTVVHMLNVEGQG